MHNRRTKQKERIISKFTLKNSEFYMEDLSTPIRSYFLLLNLDYLLIYGRDDDLQKKEPCFLQGSF